MRIPSIATVVLTSAFVLGAAATPDAVADAPFTEDFTNDHANWFNAEQTGPVNWVSAGGPDGGAYVSDSFLVPDPPPEFGALLFRAQDEFGSSGGAFEGDWIGDGVTSFSFFIRHDGLAPLDVFARFASPFNFPGAVGLSFIPVMPNIWTQIVIPIGPDSPNLIFEDPEGGFEGTFSNIGHVQIGILPNEGFIGQTLTVDLDKVSIIPAPGALALIGFGALAYRRRRR